MAPELLCWTEDLVARVSSGDDKGEHIRPALRQRLRAEAALIYHSSLADLG